MVRLLVIGTGGMAANHARAFAAMPGVELVGGVDPRPEPLAAFNAEHGIARGFASLGAGGRLKPGTALPAPAPVFPRWVEEEAPKEQG